MSRPTRFRRTALLSPFPLLLAACLGTPSETREAGFGLPAPVANNAVAIADSAAGPTLFSFNGLAAGKTWRDVTALAYACPLSSGTCETIDGPPVEAGRLASAAVTVGNKIYLFGGYTVAENGDEKSTPEVFRFDPVQRSYTRVADMPTPVDDMIALAYRDRYIYLVSGWHDTGNVRLVQLYDTRTDSWREATAFPGEPVFGHAGGLVGETIVVADGVAVTGVVDGRRQFGLVSYAWRGDIDPENPATIRWRRIEQHPGDPLYRMASMGDEDRGQVIFAGGADNAYNYNGVGYDGVPAKASARIFAYDIAGDRWIPLGTLDRPSMDHRNLAKAGETYYIAGGMDARRQVTARIARFSLPEKD